MGVKRSAILGLALIGTLGACSAGEVPEQTGVPMGAPPARGSETTASAITNHAPAADEADRAAARVDNQVPVLLGVVIEPMGAVTVRHDVVANARANDPDGDELELRFVWRVNGKRVNVDGAVLPKEQFRRGDRIELAVVASDGVAESEPLYSHPFEAENAVPSITSLPGGLDEQGSFRYQVTVEDPDDERGFRYWLREGPPGMTMDTLSGLLTWEPQEKQSGRHAVTLEVEDLAGAKESQSFELQVDFVPFSAPAAPARRP